MPSAAGIIMATGIMTMVNDIVQDGSGNLNVPASAMMDNFPWRVIPATAIAAGIFYGFEQVNASAAKGLAALAFLTAFIAPRYDIVDQFGNQTGVQPRDAKTSPLGTLLKVTGNPGGSMYIKGVN
jgi:hypothetical protein